MIEIMKTEQKLQKRGKNAPFLKKKKKAPFHPFRKKGPFLYLGEPVGTLNSVIRQTPTCLSNFMVYFSLFSYVGTI